LSAAFAVPGDLAAKTGGYRYDREVVEGLGASIEVIPLSARFPEPTAEDLREAKARLLALPRGTPTVVDGLAFGVMDGIAEALAAHLEVIALVHHPLALEGPGREALAERERAALAHASRVVATSATTARTLADDYGVEAVVLPPGTRRPSPTPAPRRLDEGPLRLLCVASLSPRKGQHLLVEAVGHREDVRLTLVGAARDPDYAAPLAPFWAGELDDAGLHLAYRDAHAFALASFHEGYGMAAAEALAHGLPVLATTAGALPEVVPEAAGVLVPPG
jgi:glycosyltransferase involved in cell wall biosynthesis